MKKNTASQKWAVFAFDETDNTPKAGDAAQISAEISIDGAAGIATTDAAPTELEDGFYVFDIDADETNGDYLLIMPESSTGDIQVVGCPAGVWTTFPIESADTGSTQIARVGADSDTLETLSDEIATVKAETASIQVETTALDTLTKAAGDGDLAAVKVVTDNLAAAATTMIEGTVSWDNTEAITTVFYSNDLTEATADHYNGRVVLFTSGDLVGQATDITDYALDTGEGKFTVTALTEAPADNVTFVIV